MKITVVLPTYNEKENIATLIPQILEQNKDIDIIAVDDNSPDGTGKILDNLADKFPKKIKVIHRKVRQGVGAAVINGLKEAVKDKADLIIQMDADYSHNHFYLADLINSMKKTDVAVGSRYATGGNITSRSPWRNFVSQIANLYNHFFLGVWDVQDTASGFKCSKRAVLEAINLDKFVSNGYSIGIEQLYRTNKKGFKITEMPIIFSDRNAGKSKMGIKQILDYMLTVLKIRFTSW